jgi:hypothetical protein
MDNINLKELAPAALRKAKDGAKNGVSKYYQFMTTSDVIEGLKKMGWELYGASQQKSKKNPETTKHMLRFRHADFGTFGVNGLVPEILFINSHDRTSSLTFHVGLFRIICSNGLIVADKTFEKFTIRHMGVTFEEVKKRITEITKKLPEVFKIVKRLSAIELDAKAAKEFAATAIAIRFPEYINPKTNKVEFKKIKDRVDLDYILKPLRPEDNGKDLWTVMNVIQEKLIKGGFAHIGTTDKSKTVRAINNIRLNVLINTGVWELANKYAMA